MGTGKFLSITLAAFLSGCAKESVGYFNCAYQNLTERHSLVVDTQKKTILFDEREERSYKESGSNFLVSRVQLDNGYTESIVFDRVTGELDMVNERTNDNGNPEKYRISYDCEKTEKLI